MKEHEGRMILKFNTCLILMKSIELVVKHATDIWRDVFHLSKPTDDPVEIEDDDNDEEDDEDDNTPSVTVIEKGIQELMEEKEEEEKEEEDEEEYKD